MIDQYIPPEVWAIGAVIVGLAFYGLFNIIVKVTARILIRKPKDDNPS